MSILQNIKRPKLTDTVAERLTAAIRDGEFKPGDKLPTEQELGERFGVSRNVVREATNELRSRGLVKTRQGSGSVVTGEFHKPVRNVIADLLSGRVGAEGKLLELRRVLEVHIAELAAQRATPAQIGEMETILADFDAAGGNLRRCAELDVAFHQALARAAHNELFGVVVDPLNELLVPTRRRALERSGIETASTTHRGILAAIKARNPALAAQRMADHIDRTLETWRKRT
ncbi:MAG: FadR family transcriptional regulator [Lentisphaerae bacterium]|nr:FadR family transcriptional regulator [Lentisphaerota bacterium]